MTLSALKTYINHYVENIKVATKISGYRLNIILNEIVDNTSSLLSSLTTLTNNFTTLSNNFTILLNNFNLLSTSLGTVPLKYKALLSQNAPISTTQTPTIVAGQIWQDTIGTVNAGDLAILSAYELISGTLGAINAKYRSAADATPVFVTTSFAYDGSPYVVSIDVNGNLNPFVNTIGAANNLYEYASVGNFRLNLGNLLIPYLNKVFVRITNTYGEGYTFAMFADTGIENRISFYITNAADLAVDGILYYTPVEIEVNP